MSYIAPERNLMDPEEAELIEKCSKAVKETTTSIGDNSAYIKAFQTLFGQYKSLPNISGTSGLTGSISGTSGYGGYASGTGSISGSTTGSISGLQGSVTGSISGLQGSVSKQAYRKEDSERAVRSSKVKEVRKVYRFGTPKVLFRDLHRTMRIIPSPVDLVRINIMGCCVCKTKTRANMPWYRPWLVMRVLGVLKEDFPYKDVLLESRSSDSGFLVNKRNYYFSVCSKECEHFIYLSLLDL